MYQGVLRSVLAGICAYELAALIAESLKFDSPKTISVLMARSNVLKGALAAGYVGLGVHVAYLVKGD